MSDWSDSQWAIIEPLFPPAGNRSKWEKRELVDAVLYFVNNGCKWRNLPHDFPPYTTVANFYYAAIKSRLWKKIRAALVEKVRIAGRNANPSYAIIDSQSVKTTSAAENRGIDGGKNKRAQAAYRSGYHAANIHDTKSGIQAAREAFKNTHPFSDFVRMPDIAKHLNRMFLRNWALVWIFQRASSLNGKSDPNAGLWNAPWLGSTTLAASLRIMR